MRLRIINPTNSIVIIEPNTWIELKVNENRRRTLSKRKSLYKILNVERRGEING